MSLGHSLRLVLSPPHPAGRPFLIGGADGLDPELKARAEGLIRISSMTLPHGIVRVMLAEQLYRAWSITQNHPYHRV